MIPHKLRLSNFMCYREEQSLDFSGIHLACLAGDNGHGKSALLDAVTWALWGKARAQRDDELITLGETEMWVEFEFGLAGQRYRVWRQRSKKGRGQGDLHFYVWNPAQAAPGNDGGGEGWQLLDEGGLRERQALITRTLRMEYETFVNSAFLLQGKADSFTVKTASERKQILADILGLSRYDGYEERAKGEAQARKERAGLIEGEIKGIERDLARRGDYEAQLAAARAAALAAADTLRKAEAEQSKARLAVQSLQAQADQLAGLRRRMARAEEEAKATADQLQAGRTRLAQIEAVLDRRVEIENGWAELQKARADDAAWNARLLRYTQVQEQINRARLAVSQARLAVEAEQRRLSDRAADLGRKVAAGQEQASILAQARAALSHLDELQVRRDAIVATLRETAERSAGLKVESDRLKAEGQAVKDKMAMMVAAETANCPLCGQPLEADHRDRMLADLTAERETLAERYRAAQIELRTLAERRTELESQDAHLTGELRARDPRQRQVAQAEAVVAEGQAAAEEQNRVAEQIALVVGRLAAEDYAPDERAELARLQAELAAVGYDVAAHDIARKQAERFGPFDTAYQRQLLPALDGEAGARALVTDLAAQLARREGDLATERAEAERLAECVAGLSGLKADLERADAAVESAAVAERRARQSEGAAMQQLGALDALAERRRNLAVSLDALNAEISIYNQLREAFGKKGLQAMIIESAIPEVETEANRLLSRMSDGRMSLRLETQREKVTGGLAETLDIIISDELGARAYEMYSGGEAFRANLSLRIAISKLLARRAGAQLQTLVIDEGLGSQDVQGRSLVVEAINSIQGDFERIIVITHIEELKDQFPARIDVVKTASGSRVSIT